MIGRSIDPLYAAGDRGAGEGFDPARASWPARQVDSRETVRLHKNGERIDVSISVAPLRDAGGAIVGISSIMRDIRAHKEAERKLAESHERLRALAACPTTGAGSRTRICASPTTPRSGPRIEIVIGARYWAARASSCPSSGNRSSSAREHAQHAGRAQAVQGSQISRARSQRPRVSPDGQRRADLRAGWRLQRLPRHRARRHRARNAGAAAAAAVRHRRLLRRRHHELVAGPARCSTWNPGATPCSAICRGEILGKSVSLLMPPGQY